MFKKIVMSLSLASIIGLSTFGVSSSALASDHGDTYDTATEITVGDYTRGVINVGGDEDWFKFVAPSTGTYSIRTTGKTDTYGWLYEEYRGEPSYLARDDDGSGVRNNFEINHRLYAGETYYVNVTGYDDNEYGNYILIVE